MEFFLKHQRAITRAVGAVLLLVGFVSYFWVSPQKVLSENEKAAANVARHEAKVAGVAQSKAKAKPASAIIAEKYEETRKTQLRYFTILVMVFGGGFLLYSFLKKEE